MGAEFCWKLLPLVGPPQLARPATNLSAVNIKASSRGREGRSLPEALTSRRAAESSREDQPDTKPISLKVAVK